MKWSFIRIPLLLALLLVLAVAMLTTGTGLRLIARLALPLIPGQIGYESLQGRVIGPLNLTGLKWENDGQTLVIEQVGLNWRPAKLFSRHVYIQQLDARGVSWQAPEADNTEPEEPAQFSLPKLPVSITAQRLQIDDILIAQGASQLRIQNVQVAGQLDNDRYRLETLLVKSDEFDVDGNATIDMTVTPHDVDAALNWTARPNNTDIRIEGRTSAQGNMDALDFDTSTSGSVELVLSGTATKLIDSPRVEGEINLKRFDPALAGLDASTGTISAELDYSGSPDAFALAGRIVAPDILPAAAIIDTDASLDGNTLELSQLTLRLENLTTTARVSGTLLTDLSDLNLRLDWTDLQWPLGQQPQFASPDGRVSVTGSKDRYRVELDGTTAAGLIPAARVTLRGNGTSSEFEVIDLSAAFEKGRLTARGGLDWADIPTARLDIATQDLDLSQWQGQLEGRLGFDSLVVASLPAEGAKASVEVSKIAGQLQDKTLTGSGAFDYLPGLVRLRRVDIRAGQARIEANGQLGADIDLSWNISVPDVALLLPGSAGSVRSKGTVRGKRDNPGLVGDLVVRDLQASNLAAARVDGDFDIGVAADSSARFNLRAEDVTFGTFSAGTVEASSSGTVARHSIGIEVDSSSGKLSSAFEGGLADNTWQGEITKLSLSRRDIGLWSIAEPTRLGLRSDSIELQKLCLAQEQAQLCVGGTLATAGPWRGDFELANLPLQRLASQLPVDLDYEGVIEGQGYAAATTDGWGGEASVRLSNGRVLTRESGDDNVLIAYEGGSLDATFDPVAVRTRLNLDLRDAGIIEADITVPLDNEQQLAGTVQARVGNLSIVTAMVPQIGRIDGRLEADLRLAGTMQAPDLSGNIGLQTTELVLPDLGVTLQDTVVNVTTRGNELVFDGSADSGDGQVALTGDLRWRQGLPSGQLKIEGENFRAVDLPEIRLDATPALTLNVDGQNINFAGSIAVPSAQITPIDISSGVAVTPDQVIVGDAAPASAQESWKINGSVEVTVGPAVFLKGYGLEGNLNGSVVIVESPGQPTIGRGALEITDGRYRAYGQELKIETGRLTFTGGQIDDPGLNLRATREAGEVTAGVQVRGALRAPVLSLYSSPALSETQIMSYLITGRSLEELDERDQTTVSETATRLALKGGSFLASRFGRDLGLDSVEFRDDGATASTELVVGKQLSPRLFVSYGIGLFEAINTVRLRYRINSRLTLETQSGTRTSADLLYSVER